MDTTFADVSFEWDEAKRQANLAKHGLDFLRVTRLFDGQVVTRHSPRGDESRFVTVGRVDGRLVAAVWTLRGDTIRLISARSAHHGERRHYHQTYPARDRGDDRAG
jgi:uncharacterized DUF497 family protein